MPYRVTGSFGTWILTKWESDGNTPMNPKTLADVPPDATGRKATQEEAFQRYKQQQRRREVVPTIVPVATPTSAVKQQNQRQLKDV